MRRIVAVDPGGGLGAFVGRGVHVQAHDLTVHAQQHATAWQRIGCECPCGLVAAPARWRSARSPAAPPAFELEGDTEPAGDVPQAATMTITTAPRRDRFIGNTTRAGPPRFPTARGLRYRGTERVAMADLSYPTVPL